MGRNGHVTTAVLQKICVALECQISDVMEIIPEDNLYTQTSHPQLQEKFGISQQIRVTENGCFTPCAVRVIEKLLKTSFKTSLHIKCAMQMCLKKLQYFQCQTKNAHKMQSKYSFYIGAKFELYR